jgi:DNA-binding transcriptional ArsR family regulator
MELRRDVFQAIADPTRRDILGMLTTQPQNVNTLADNFHMTRQAVSLHVRILLECGVIAIEQKGRERFCKIIPDSLAEIDDWLTPFRKLWDDRFQQLDDVLKKMKKKSKS